MTVRITQPQAQLLANLHAAGPTGVFKPTSYTPADILVTLGYAKWMRKFDNGRCGCLVITQKGIDFRLGGR